MAEPLIGYHGQPMPITPDARRAAPRRTARPSRLGATGGRRRRSMGPPRPRPEIDFQRLPDGSGLLVDTTSGATFAINEGAAALWEICDGRLTAAALTAILARQHAVSAIVLRPLIDAVLSQWCVLGLLAPTSLEPGSPGADQRAGEPTVQCAPKAD